MRWLKFLPWMLLVWIPTTARADSIVTSWREMTLTQQVCTQRAIQAMKEAGLSGLSVMGELADGDQSVFGNNGEYFVSIRCISRLKLAFFVTTGPSSEEAGALQHYLRNRFGPGNRLPVTQLRSTPTAQILR